MAFLYITTKMLSWFKAKKDKSGLNILIDYVDRYERDILTLIDLLSVSKAVAVKVNNTLQQFYSIS